MSTGIDDAIKFGTKAQFKRENVLQAAWLRAFAHAKGGEGSGEADDADSEDAEVEDADESDYHLSAQDSRFGPHKFGRRNRNNNNSTSFVEDEDTEDNQVSHEEDVNTEEVGARTEVVGRGKVGGNGKSHQRENQKGAQKRSEKSSLLEQVAGVRAALAERRKMRAQLHNQLQRKHVARFDVATKVITKVAILSVCLDWFWYMLAWIINVFLPAIVTFIKKLYEATINGAKWVCNHLPFFWPRSGLAKGISREFDRNFPGISREF
jgi:hypothetical protein